MKKTLVLLFLIFFGFTSKAEATDEPYVVKSFHSDIAIQQNMSVLVKETIEVEFLQKRHGIYRVIPIVYTTDTKTIAADFNFISVKDEQGKNIPIVLSRLKQSIKLKIGDADKTIIGPKTYVIEYKISRVIRNLGDDFEFYWNVVGPEWSSTILGATAVISSDYASITRTNCFSGQLGTKAKFCQILNNNDVAEALSLKPISFGQDLTVVLGLDKDNSFIMPTWQDKFAWALKDYWGYLAVGVPLLLMSVAWWKYGRDDRYLSDVIFYKDESGKKKKVSPFSRPHLPLAYGPIDGFTPAQIGTIIDERADFADITAEIIELARLGLMKIEKQGKKGFFRNQKYLFTKIKNKKTNTLKEYQKILFDSIFEKNDSVYLHKLKGKLSAKVPQIRKEIYQSLVEEKVFPKNPQTIRIVWTGISILLTLLSLSLIFIYYSVTANGGPFALIFISAPLSLLLAAKMSRKTAWGYSLFRQTKGLKWYLGKGKWRQEINEKQLFLEEMLPIAISLGVVNKLTKDMAMLGVEPPAYFVGTNMAYFNSDLAHFRSTAIGSFTPQASGRSSWSGGSGFSGGGFSGGGFGGGGGGSW